MTRSSAFTATMVAFATLAAACVAPNGTNGPGDSTTTTTSAPRTTTSTPRTTTTNASAPTTAAPTTSTTAPRTTTSTPRTTTTAAAPTTSGAPVGPSGRFNIVGRDIVDPDGNIFYPVGANVAVRQGQYETGYIFNWNGTATGHANDAKAWGWNIVRTNLICQPPGSPTVAELNAGIDAFIDEYTAKKIVVMVDCHDVTGKNYSASSSQIQALYPFWDRLARKYKDNPYVWFNMFNEPSTGKAPADVDNWMALQRDALARLRAIAPNNVFVADIPGWGQGVSTFTGSNPVTNLGAGQCNVLYAWHAYGALTEDGPFGTYADWGDEAASLRNHRAVLSYIRDHNIPVVIGELGDPLTLNEGTAGMPIWNRNGARAVMTAAPEYGVGMLWWHATGDSGIFLTYSLMADRHQAPWSAATTGAGLSDGGQRFWNVSKHAPNLGRFTGDLSRSNCG